MYAEFVLALNWHSWLHHEKNNPELMELYADLYEEANDRAYSTYKGEDMQRYFEITD